MIITLASGSPQLLRIQWEPYTANIEAKILERLKEVPGAEGAGRRWYTPAIQMDRLMVLFPMASFQYAALCAADKAARNFYESMVTTGVKLIIEGAKVQAIGDNVSPLVAQLIDDRSPALMSFVELEMDRASLKPQPVEPVQGPLSRDEALVESIGKGILNAQKRAELQERFQYGKRQGKKKPTQGAFEL